MIRLLVLILSLFGLFAVPTRAGSPISVPATCPIGGKAFEYGATASYSIFGYRADGKPFGSWEFPLELPVCPDNGLVMFDEFTPAEVKTLTGLIAKPEYRALAATETNYFRAWWLMKRLDRAADSTAWMLVQASWQSDDDAARKARYQTLYAEEIAKLPKGRDEVSWLLLQGRAANALRELGRFDEAAAMLSGLPLHILDVAVPAEKVAGTTPSGLGRSIENFADIREAQRKRGFLTYFSDLKALIAERNPGSEPVRMMRQRDAVQTCSNATGLSDADKAFCISPEMKALAKPAPT